MTPEVRRWVAASDAVAAHRASCSTCRTLAGAVVWCPDGLRLDEERWRYAFGLIALTILLEEQPAAEA